MSEKIKNRRGYVRYLRQELVGPGSECRASLPMGIDDVPEVMIREVDDETEWASFKNEIISERPSQRYSVGILYPQIGQDDEVAEDADAAANETEPDLDENADEEGIDTHTKEQSGDNAFGEDVPVDVDSLEDSLAVELATTYKPSSMGFTFYARQLVSTIRGKAFFATYRRVNPQETKSRVDLDEGVAAQCLERWEGCNVRLENDGGALWVKTDSNVQLMTDSISKAQEAGIQEDDAWEMLNAIKELSRQGRNGYIREPHSIGFEVTLSDNGTGVFPIVNVAGVNASVRVARRRVNNDCYGYTLMLVNEAKDCNAQCLMQAALQVGKNGNQGIDFVSYAGFQDFSSLDFEEQSLALQYRNKKIYATGLGTAVDWGETPTGDFIIRSECMPVHEVPGMDFSIGGAGDVLQMKNLSDMSEWDKESLNAELTSFVNLYGEWISDQETQCKAMQAGEFPEYHQTAGLHIERCKESLKRMRDGIDVLNENDNALKAFKFANRAMFMQQVHRMFQSGLADDVAPDNDVISKFNNTVKGHYKVYATIGTDDEPDIIRSARGCDGEKPGRMPSWRPFQLAFLLMSLKSVVDPDDHNRDIVDLIWFPTGGGKTEAYLGLTAFSIFYRRLAYRDNAGGTTVIMRYTLRLLTAQQFERASALICACEVIRQNNPLRRRGYLLGNDPISIGLWIGGSQTPNTFGDAQQALTGLINNNGQNKFQVLRCPWCGSPLFYRDPRACGYHAQNNGFTIGCTNDNCVFSQSLPLQVIDEGLYNNPPTLLFGTVDKFAQIAWKTEASTLFACNNGNGNRSPELIIQDELHLISGPLGTIVGVYEAAIDYMCSLKGVKPKIVASTATIRRASEQCSMLYNRSTRQFPPPGINAGESFFATEQEIDYDAGRYGRLYVGIMPAGETKATMFGRSMAALLQRQMNLSASNDAVRDHFWTVTAYFNSLRDLGNASSYLEADVKSNIKRMFLCNGGKKRRLRQKEELTSRVSASELTAALKQLQTVKYSSENETVPTDALMATNMISVGVDIDRLNVMLMQGQPKLTSEYIQASSRVGRSGPGVVFVLYDAMKSRDRSYYEQFKSYHDAYYKFVEPTAVTPFAEPALERCLHAALIAALRGNPNAGMSRDDAAGNFEQQGNVAESVKNYFTGRLQSIITRAEEEDAHSPADQRDVDMLMSRIGDFFNEWTRVINLVGSQNLQYGNMNPNGFPNKDRCWLLKPYGRTANCPGMRFARDTLTAMRNVDTTVGGFVREEN